MPSTNPAPAADTAPDAHATPPPAVQPEAAPGAMPPATTPAECGQRLKQLWPGLFAGAAKPIKLRIQKDIQARSPGTFSRSVLSAFLHRHTGSTSYLLAIASGGPRFDLDGQPDGEVSDEHRKAAADELARRRANRAAREEIELQQRRNRAGLLRDFERTTLTRANFCALKGVADDELDHLLAVAREEAAHPPAPPRGRPPRQDGRGLRPDARGPRLQRPPR